MANGDGETSWHPPVLTPQGTLIVGTDRNQVYAFEASTGKRLWVQSLGRRYSIFPYGDFAGPAVDAKGALYVTSSNGSIYAFK